jgi:hypothetical protein
LTVSDKSFRARISNNSESRAKATFYLTEKYLFLTNGDSKKLDMYIDKNLYTLLSMNKWKYARQIIRLHLQVSFFIREIRLIKIFLTSKVDRLKKIRP